MKKMKLKGKLIGGFLLVALMTLTVGFIGWNGVKTTDEALQEVAVVRLPSIEGLEKMNEAQTAIQRGERSLLIPEFLASDKERQHQLDGLADAWKRAGEGWKIYEPLPQTREEEQLWKRFVPAWEGWKKAHEQIVELLKSGKREEALAASNGKGRETFNASETLLGELVQLNVRVADEFTKEAVPKAHRARLFSLIGMGLGTLLAVGLGIALSRSATKPILQVVSGLTDGSEQVASAASQVSSASQNLAEGASEQAAAIEETSSSLEEMASMARQNSENAGEANELMRASNAEVEKATSSMEQLNSSMIGITQASEETQKIVKTIDEIAFQTNLLALNAAVEAARAGEAGAGFAVVADEVRNLAMRAAEAAKTTANLIEDTVRRIRAGADVASQTSEAFAKVTESSMRVGALVAEIAAASREQSQGAEQISKAISEMDKVVQQNAANAEETASASEELSAQAEQMQAYVKTMTDLVGTAESRERSRKPARRKTSEIEPGRVIAAVASRVEKAIPAKPKGKALPKPGSGAKRPEDLIPFDDDGMQDF